MSFTREEKIAALTREIELRYRVYPLLVRARRMLQADLEREVALMVDIRADYEAKDLAFQPMAVADAYIMSLPGEPGERA